MESVTRFLSWLGRSLYRTDPDCIMGLIIIAVFVYVIVDTICVIIERRRKKRLIQTRRNEKASWEGYTMIQKHPAGKKRKSKTRRDLRQGCISRTIIHRYEWERDQQPDIGRSVEPAPPVKFQIRRYIRQRVRELLQ